MKKFILILISFIFLSSFPVQLFAQEPPAPPNTATQKWFCLTGNRVGGSHKATLTIKDESSVRQSEPIYVVVKIAFNEEDTNPTADNSGMTTGKRDLDTHVFNSTKGLDDLVRVLEFKGGLDVENPTTFGSFPTSWSDDLKATEDTKIERAHFWYGMQELNPEPVAAVGNGNEGAQQQGTFSWAVNEGKGKADCDFVSWDPFGYVFDAQTHGPIQGESVLLLSSATPNGVYSPVPVGIGKGMVSANPVTTKKDGSYKFYVEPGYYKLKLSKYTIETDITNIKPGYEEFGYEQIYIANAPEVIHELEGKVERRDIAIKTIGAPAPFASTGPKLSEVIFHNAVQNGIGMVRLSGRALFIPVDLTGIYKDTNGLILEEKKISLSRGHAYVPQGSKDQRNFDIWMNAATTDGTGTLTEIKISSKYSSITNSLAVPSMPEYLDGIATTKTGVPIIGGTVEIYPIGSNSPIYTTTTDETGHFGVANEWIPPMPYELRYKTVTGYVIKVSTSEYLKQNAIYHKENAINSYVVKEVESKSRKPKTAGNIQSTSSRSPTQSQKNSSIGASGTQGIVMVVVALLMLVLLGVGAFVMMKSRQQQTQF